MIEWFDTTCGDLIGYLEKKNIRDNTLIIYIGDNGWIQHPEKRGYDQRSKQTPYEGGIRQPTLYPSRGNLNRHTVRNWSAASTYSPPSLRQQARAIPLFPLRA